MVASISRAGLNISLIALAFGIVGQLRFDGFVKVRLIQAVLHNAVFFELTQCVGVGNFFADLAYVLQYLSVCGSYPEIPDNCYLL